jgi:stage V sporulation protein S
MAYLLKVSSKSSSSSIAGAIAGMIKDGASVEIQSVGAGAVNQAVKAIAIARGFLEPVGIELVCVPTFVDVEIDGELRTAMHFDVEKRYGRTGLHERSETQQCELVAGLH